MNMQRINRHTHEMFFITFLLLVTLTLAGCGGSGGSESTTPTAQETQSPTQNEESNETTSAEENKEPDAESYAPEESRLEQEASSSSELYVEPDFQFDTFKAVTFDLLLTDNEGQPMANTIIFVSAIAQEITELDDPALANKSLISVLKTDASGAVYRQLEMSQTVNKVLFEINAIGTENEHIKDISEMTEVHIEL